MELWLREVGGTRVGGGDYRDFGKGRRYGAGIFGGERGGRGEYGVFFSSNLDVFWGSCGELEGLSGR